MGKDQPCRVKLRIWRYQPRPPADAPSGAPDAPGDAPPGAARGSAAAARPGEAAAAVRAASAGSGDSSQSGGGAASAPAAAGAPPGLLHPNPNLGGGRPAWPPPLDAPLLTIADAVLCSEMGVHFSPCGRYLAACVACRVRPPPVPPPAAACGGMRGAVRLREGRRACRRWFDSSWTCNSRARVGDCRTGAREPLEAAKSIVVSLPHPFLIPQCCAQAPAPNPYAGTLSGALALAHTAEEAADGRPAGPGAGVVYEARRPAAGLGSCCYLLRAR